MKKEEKTNVMRILEQKKASYIPHLFDKDLAVAGNDVAALLGEDPERCFKTLVTVGRSGRYYVYMIPVCGELDLKAAAKAAGEKSVEMIPQKQLLPLTGYIHGGCSPIGMKKLFPTFLHRTAADFGTIYFSGGKQGCQVEMAPEELCRVIEIRYADLIV